MESIKTRIGHWTTDEAGLPAYALTAELPLTEGLAPGEPAIPLFLLGNHGLTAFVHADGAYQLHTGERCWAQLNPGKNQPGAACESRVRIDGDLFDLRTSAASSRMFGCGIARLTYDLPKCQVERELCTPPSLEVGNRRPVVFISLKITNTGQEPLSLEWTEGLTARYDFSFRHNYPYTGDRLQYVVKPETQGSRAEVSFCPETDQSLVLGWPLEPNWQEILPPFVQMMTLSDELMPSVKKLDLLNAQVTASGKIQVAPGKTEYLRVAVGYSLVGDDWLEMLHASLPGLGDGFRAEWSQVISDWDDAKDPELAQEMRWHYYTLQAMATWSEVYRETFIPQGTVYEYALGVAAVIRDHLQHALPLCYCDPQLAASILRYTGKHTDPWGHIMHGDEGAGQHPLGADQKSDSQIYALYTLAEYLRAGNSPEILLEPIHFLGSPRETDLLDCAIRWVRYLRDTVSTGAHGFLRLLCSDWNDCFYGFFQDLPYSKIFHDAESGLNTAMAIVALERLATGLKDAQFKRLKTDEALEDRKRHYDWLIAGCRELAGELKTAIKPFLENRDFLVRAMVEGEFDPSNEAFAKDDAGAGSRVVGLNELFFEPQPHLLAIPDLAEEYDRIWSAIRQRVYDDEPCGARQREKPGIRENGGIWFALNGPLVDALAAYDPDAAREALEKLTCRRRAQTYPDRWIGQWSCGDSIHSHHLDDPEKAGRVASYLYPMPVFCAHAHAWPLHGWLRLNSNV